jgi:hypothetical protein
MNGILAPSPRKLPLICTLAASCSFAASNSATSETHQPAGSVWMAVSDDALDDMRGGFDFGGGLVLNFGIDRAVYINGALVTSTSITFNNLSDLKPEQLALLNKYAPVVNLIQNGPGNTFQPPPASQASAAPAAQGAPPTSNNAARPASASSTVVDHNLSPASATFIQNSLNNQHIQSMTVVNATVNSMGILKSLNSLTTLQDALSHSITGRL